MALLSRSHLAAVLVGGGSSRTNDGPLDPPAQAHTTIYAFSRQNASFTDRRPHHLPVVMVLITPSPRTRVARGLLPTG